MKKVFLIGWWVDPSNYKDFKEYLELQEFDPYEERLKWWKDNLQEDLWEGYEVIKIPMPNKWYAQYEYWSIMFEKALPYFWEENILIWHSLWWSFLLKYLSSKNIENISQIHLVAPALFDSEQEKLWSFTPDNTLENYKKYESLTTAYFSRDDDIVWFENCEWMKEKLPNVKYEIFEDKGHFIFEEHFKELVENIKNK